MRIVRQFSCLVVALKILRRISNLLIVISFTGVAANASAGILAWYDFNDASDAAVVRDVSGSGNDGVVNIATYTADGTGYTGSPGDRALDLGDYDNGAFVDIPSASEGAFDSIASNDEATVMFWINGGSEQPAPQWTFYAGPGRQLGAHTPWSDSTIYFDTAGCCGENQRISRNEPDSSKYSVGWNHYAFVMDGTQTTVYQNGELFVQSADGIIDPVGAITEFFVGSGPSGDHRSYNGLIDDFLLWDLPLSGDAIAEFVARRDILTCDFDGGGSCELADVDMLLGAVGTDNSQFDLNNSGTVEIDDINEWLATAGNENIGRPYRPGDATLDGNVDAMDLNAVGINWQSDSATSWAQGDFNGDRNVNAGDLNILGVNWQQSAPLAARVPEPSGYVLALGGLMVLLGHWCYTDSKK